MIRRLEIISGIDKRNKLDEKPFSYNITKKGTVIIYHQKKQIKIVKDKEADKLKAKIKEAKNNEKEIQLLLAKITGNFKHGNEKTSRGKNSK